MMIAAIPRRHAELYYATPHDFADAAAAAAADSHAAADTRCLQPLFFDADTLSLLR